MSGWIATVALSYLLGSIPFGYLLLRAFRGQDVCKSGSGNIGATNVARSSPALGILTLLLDASKGLAAVALAQALFPSQRILGGVAALVAIVGHIFPLWLRFRGGKGVATGFGSFLMLAPKAVLLTIGVFVAVVLLFRYVSLGSIVAVSVFPFFAILVDGGRKTPALFAFSAAAAILIVFRHR